MNLTEVVKFLNRMVQDKIIENYAIGGHVGAMFYIEPISTLEVDVYLLDRAGSSIKPGPGGWAPFMEYLSSKGYYYNKRMYVVISETPVFFLPSGGLTEEAIEQAVQVDLEGVPVRVITAEYLAAISLLKRGSKDKTLLLQFMESRMDISFNARLFNKIIKRHKLSLKWGEFKEKFTHGPVF